MSLSIIELVVYGLFAYSSMLVLITSINKEPPSGKTPAIIRSIYLIPGIICAALLALAGTQDIGTVTIDLQNVIKNLNNTETWSETTTSTSTIILQNEVWIVVHVMIMLVLLAYVIQQLVELLIKYKP